MTVWRYSILSLVATLLVACVAAPAPREVALAPPPAGDVCQAYAQAWVTHFRAHVAKADVATTEQQLLKVRAQLATAGTAEAGCELPFCMVRPLAGGRLDSYCGYRRPDPSGRELYQWVSFR